MQQRSEETRGRILSASLKLFAQSGYNAAGVAEICAEAGVSKGAFYHHFPSKQAVFLCLLDSWLAEIDRSLAAARLGTGTVAEALVRMAERVRGFFVSADGRLPMFLEFWIQASRDPAIWQATIDPYHRYQAFFAGIIREGIGDGSLRPVDPDLAARAIVSLAVGLFLQGVLDPHGAAWDQVTVQSVQLFMDGLARRPA